MKFKIVFFAKYFPCKYEKFTLHSFIEILLWNFYIITINPFPTNKLVKGLKLIESFISGQITFSLFFSQLSL